MRLRGTDYLVAAVAAGIGIPAALAPSTGWAQIEEIVVTSRRKDENLQDVPLAVAAFDAATIEKLGISTTSDVLKLIPGVQFDQAFSAADTRISIRGINNTRGRTSVAILVDGIDVSGENVTSGGGSSLLNSRLLDLERVEVVKGPQSALYGRNAFAGAINYITKKPSMDGLHVNVSVDDVANYSIYDLRASISGPVVPEKLALSLNAGTWNSDGFFENHNPTDTVANVGLGGGKSDGVRLGALWTPTESLNITSSVSYTENEFEPRAVAKVANSNTFYLAGVSLPPGTQPSFTSDLPGQPIVIRIEWRKIGAQGNTGRSGEGRHVDQQAWLLGIGQGQRVREHQAAFGIGVANFDRDPLPAAQHIARPEGIAGNRVFDSRNENPQADREFRRHDHLRQTQDGGSTAHVLLHQQHARGGLDVEAAGVETHTLADQRDLRRPYRSTAEIDEPRGAGAGPADGVDHREFAFQNLAGYDLQLRLESMGHRSRRRLQLVRPHIRSRGVDQVAHQVAGPGGSQHRLPVYILRANQPHGPRWRLAIGSERIGLKAPSENCETGVSPLRVEGISPLRQLLADLARNERVALRDSR